MKIRACARECRTDQHTLADTTPWFNVILFIYHVCSKSYLLLEAMNDLKKNCGEDRSREKLRTHLYILTINL